MAYTICGKAVFNVGNPWYKYRTICYKLGSNFTGRRSAKINVDSPVFIIVPHRFYFLNSFAFVFILTGVDKLP